MTRLSRLTRLSTLNRFGTLARVSVLAVVASASPAPAQGGDPIALLESCSRALAGSGSGSADWVIDGIAPAGPFADIKPSGFGTVQWARDGENVVVRFKGQISRTQKSDPELIDFAFSAGKAVTLDPERETLVERDPDGRAHERLSTARKLMSDWWIEPRPFNYELESNGEYSLGEETVIDGQTCGVVICKLPDLDPAQKRANPRRNANLIRVYVARSDSLPRRVEAIADNPMISIGESIELSNVKTGLGLTPADLEILPPEGWRVDSNLIGDKRTKPVGAPGAGAPADAPDDAAQTPRRLPRPTAAPFSFTTEDGRTITNETQRGRVTVLYFWGSWCLPCREYSPLVSKIAENAAEAPIDVFGLAIRERSPLAPKEIMNKGQYAHALVMGADGLVNDFKVRVYPTIVVLDKEARVVVSVHPEPGKTAEQVMAKVSEALATAAGE